jgi:hypothetical protein
MSREDPEVPDEDLVSPEDFQSAIASLQSRCKIGSLDPEWYTLNSIGTSVRTSKGYKYYIGERMFCNATDFQRLYKRTPASYLTQAAAEAEYRRSSPIGIVPPSNGNPAPMNGSRLFSQDAHSDLTENTSDSSLPSGVGATNLQEGIVSTSSGGTNVQGSSVPAGGVPTPQPAVASKSVPVKKASDSQDPHVAVAIAVQAESAKKQEAKRAHAVVAGTRPVVRFQAPSPNEGEVRSYQGEPYAHDGDRVWVPPQRFYELTRYPPFGYFLDTTSGEVKPKANPSPPGSVAFPVLVPEVGEVLEVGGEFRVLTALPDQWGTVQEFQELYGGIPKGLVPKPGTQTRLGSSRETPAGQYKFGETKVIEGQTVVYQGPEIREWVTPQEHYDRHQHVVPGFFLNSDTGCIRKSKCETRVPQPVDPPVARPFVEDLRVGKVRQGDDGAQAYTGVGWVGLQECYQQTGVVPDGCTVDSQTNQVVLPATGSVRKVGDEFQVYAGAWGGWMSFHRFRLATHQTPRGFHYDVTTKKFVPLPEASSATLESNGLAERRASAAPPVASVSAPKPAPPNTAAALKSAPPNTAAAENMNGELCLSLVCVCVHWNYCDRSLTLFVPYFSVPKGSHPKGESLSRPD